MAIRRPTNKEDMVGEASRDVRLALRSERKAPMTEPDTPTDLFLGVEANQNCGVGEEMLEARQRGKRPFRQFFPLR